MCKSCDPALALLDIIVAQTYVINEIVLYLLTKCKPLIKGMSTSIQANCGSMHSFINLTKREHMHISNKHNFSLEPTH